MIKRLDSPYRVGRKKGDWFKFKLDLSLDVVLMYGQAGHGNGPTCLAITHGRLAKRSIGAQQVR